MKLEQSHNDGCLSHALQLYLNTTVNGPEGGAVVGQVLHDPPNHHHLSKRMCDFYTLIKKSSVSLHCLLNFTSCSSAFSFMLTSRVHVNDPELCSDIRCGNDLMFITSDAFSSTCKTKRSSKVQSVSDLTASYTNCLIINHIFLSTSCF